jgi:hypothetical protein
MNLKMTLRRAVWALTVLAGLQACGSSPKEDPGGVAVRLPQDAEPDVATTPNAGDGGQDDGNDGSACGPATCSGCCDSQGICQLGTIPPACGSQGEACGTCANPNAYCSTYVC